MGGVPCRSPSCRAATKATPGRCRPGSSGTVSLSVGQVARCPRLAGQGRATGGLPRHGGMKVPRPPKYPPMPSAAPARGRKAHPAS